MPYIGQEPVAGNFVLLDAITTSATATYALTKNSVAYSPESSRNMIVSLNGVTQAPETAYTVSGSNITFSSALTASDVIDYILVLGDVLSVGTPSDGTVGTSQMSYPLGNFSSTGIDDNATSTAITINSDEEVGVGATNPQKALHVIGGILAASSDGSTSGITIDSTATAGYASTITHSDTGIEFDTGSTLRDFTFEVSGSELMRIDTSSGNVGIGTTSPASLLELEGADPIITLDDTSAGGYAQVQALNGSLILMADEGASVSNSIVRFDVDGTERMRIDSTGNLLVGQTSAYTGTGTTITGDGGISNATASGVASSLNLAGIIGVSNGFQITTNTSNQHEYTFLNGGSVAAKIDTSGRVFIGKTSDNDNTAGHTLHSSGLVVHTRNQSRAAIFNRTTDDGEIIQFKKDGTTVGSIGSTSGVVSHIILDPRSGVKGAGLLGSSADANTGILQPTDSSGAIADGAIVLGTSSNRFKDLYLSGGAYLGGTGAANHLDDYEEGTWTPSVSAGAISGTSLSYAGTYTKIGRLVYIYFEVSSASSDVNIASYVSISGLPFTLTYPATGTAITEDIDVFDRQGFAVAIGTTLQISNAGSSSGTTSIFVGIVGTTS